MLFADFANTFAHLLLALLLVRYLQMRLKPDSQFNAALSFLFH